PTTAREAWDVLVALGRCGALDLLVLASLPGVLALPRAGWSMPRLDRQLPRFAAALRGRVTALLLTNLPLPPRLGAAADAWGTVGRAVAALDREPSLAALVEAQVRASWNGNAAHLPRAGTAHP